MLDSALPSLTRRVSGSQRYQPDALARVPEHNRIPGQAQGLLGDAPSRSSGFAGTMEANKAKSSNQGKQSFRKVRAQAELGYEGSHTFFDFSSFPRPAFGNSNA